MGSVEGIYIGPERSGALDPRQEVSVVAGRGIDGDRYYNAPPAPPRGGGNGEDLTLIEAEAIEGLKSDTGIELEPWEPRRNVVTRGIGLNELVGRRFRVGEVEALGAKLCDPCNQLEKMTQPGVLRGLVNRGGLRADVTRGGTIRVGDAVEDLGPAHHSPNETEPPTGRAQPRGSE